MLRWLRWCIFFLFFEKLLSQTPQGGKTISATDSDWMVIYVNESSLPVPNIGKGVFARMDIESGELICEYRGPVIEEEHTPVSSMPTIIPLPSYVGFFIKKEAAYFIIVDGKKKGN